MKQIIQKINAVTISFILIFVYFLGIGLAALLYALTKKKTKESNTYWEDNEVKPIDIKSFESPY